VGGRIRRAPRALRVLAIVVVLGLVAASCGGGGGGSNKSGASKNPTDTGTPTPGGKIVYGLGAAHDNFCLPGAQLAIEGIMIVQSVYDTLTEPDDNGNYVPYLAKSVTHNATFDEWTIGLREGIKFHDGTPLDANAVKQNMDAWKGGPLLYSVFKNMASVTVKDPLTVVVKTATPWVGFDQYLWATGRVGIAAPAQLNNRDTCATNLIGTGPFKKRSFDPVSGDMVVVKNPDYWRKDAKGNQLPYLDEIDWKVSTEGAQRVNGLQGGQFDVIHESGGNNLATLRDLQSQGQIKVYEEPAGRQEIGYALINVTRPPLDDLNARRALAMGTDRKALNQLNNHGLFRIADSVLDKDVPGYVTAPGYPQYNPTDAKKLVDAYKAAHGGQFKFVLQTVPDPETVALGQAVRSQLGKIGVNVDLPAPVDQATLIRQAVLGQVDAFLWRNHPGLDPDSNYSWFHSGSLINFSHMSDPVVDQALDAGRVETDAAKRRQDYETFDKRMATQVLNFWNWYTIWSISTKNNVHGILGPNLPDETGAPGTAKPADILAGYHQLLGIWVGK
jgi:peptide/nickel transport system substrate-binding protein